ncbi:hypothetical protein KLVA_32200 [Klebsiella variicola]|nr:hypothetical protein KLVA_32200 [Klebsiella variicola]
MSEQRTFYRINSRIVTMNSVMSDLNSERLHLGNQAGSTVILFIREVINNFKFAFTQN